MRSRLMRRRKFSEIQTNIELNEHGWFSVVIPAGRENLIKNPSLETNSNGYNAVGGSIARTDDWQSHGAISLAVTPTAGVNDGFYYDDPAHDFDLSENTLYWPSFDFKADGGRKYKAYVARQGGTQLDAAKPFTATGHRQRIEFPYREGDNTLVDSLTAYWKLGEATAATRLDSVGTSHLTPLGGANPGPSQTTGIIGNAAQFTNANAEYLNIADNPALSCGNIDFSFSMWVYLDSDTATRGIIAKGTGDAAATLEYRLLYNSVQDRFNFAVSDGATLTTVGSSTFGPLTTATWYHIAVWHDSVNNVLGIRINDSATDTIAHTVGCQDGAGAFKIGTSGAITNFMDGRVDEVGFWKKVLSAAEITALYNGGFGQTWNFLQRRLYVVKDNETNTRPFYVDGLQFEAGDFPTTLLVGDMVGLIPNFVDYYWTGAPHASTSVRVANSADGGRVMNLRQLGLRVKSHVGLGMIGLLAITTPLGNGGSFPQGVTNTEVNFNIIGEISGDEYQTLDMYEQALVDAFNPKRVSPWQPCKILYEPLDDCGNSIGETLEIAAIPDGEFMPLQTDNLNTRVLALPFKRYLPFVAKNIIEQGATISYQDAATANYFMWRDGDGNWFGENLNGRVYDTLLLPDGTWALVGEFTDAGGDLNADALAKFNPVTRTFSSFNSTPLTNGFGTLSANAMVLYPDGSRLLFSGAFFNAGGDANADFIAQLNLATGVYSSINATVLSGGVETQAMVLLPDGTVAIGGVFLNAGGDANADFLARVNLVTGAFSSFNATPLNSTVFGLVVDKVGNLVILGDFTNAGGATGDYAIKMIGLVFTPLVLSGPLNATTYTAAVGENGEYFIGGVFTDAGGADGDRAVRYNGISFLPLALGIGDGTVFFSNTLQDGKIFFGGSFTIVSNLPFSDRAAFWTGSTFIPLDIDFPGSAIVFSYREFGDKVAVGFSTAGTAVFADVTTITNLGTDDSYPTFIMRGPSQVISLKNLENGAEIFFNLALIAGEEATLSLGPNTTFYSDKRGNILGTILPGSNTAGFVLKSGENKISMFSTYTARELNDGGNQLSAYSLQGVTVLNSDNGRLYVSIVNLGGSDRRADFYSDSARTLLVAQTGTYAAGGSQAVTQANSSGITGTLTVDVVGAADVDITADFPVVTMKWNPAYASISGAVRPRVF